MPPATTDLFRMPHPTIANASVLLARGSPRFRDPALQALASAGDGLGAWLGARSRGDREAAAGVDGDFAIALRDGTGRSFMAVDRFGIRTLCYRVCDGQLRVAERADALADTGTPVDPQAIYDYLHSHAIASPRTIYRGVHRLPPGHFAVFDRGVVTVARYWTPSFRPLRGARFDELREEFRALLRQAVTRQLGAGRPACFLSGGTDSSTVAGLLRDVTGQTPATYSIGFEAEGYDEMEYARIAARHFSTEHHEYYVTPADLIDGIPKAAAFFDQPFGNSSVLPAWCCARMARGDGVRRLLAGDGGDELFGGNSRYAKQRVFGWYGRVPASIRAALLEPLLLRTPLGSLPLARKGASYIRQARVPMPDRLEAYNLLEHLDPANVLTPTLLAQVDAGSSLVQQRAVWNEADADDELDRNLAFDWRYTLAESDLPKVRMATELADVEVGFPLLDDDLLAFSERLPTAYKLRGLTLRWFFKQALRGFLPDAIITKPKHGFGLPFGVWATRHPALSAFAADAVHGLADRGVLRADFASTLLREKLHQVPGYYGEMVWISVMLEHWLRHHAPTYRAAG